MQYDKIRILSFKFRLQNFTSNQAILMEDNTSLTIK